MPAFELPLAQNRGIPSEPLKLRVTGCLTPRGAERLYIAALTSDIKALAAVLPAPPPAPEPAEPPASVVEPASKANAQKSKGAVKGGAAAKPPIASEQPPAPASLVPLKPAEWSIVDVYGDAPVALAAGAGSVEAVRLLLEARVSPNAANERDGRTALHRACASRHAAVVAVLVSGGAGMEVAARDGSTPLHAAAAGGMAEVIEALIPVPVKGEGGEEDDAPPPPPPPAILNKADLCGLTPLMAAAGGGSAGVCAVLCDRGAEMEAQDENGWTALFHAVDAGAADAAAELSRRGANRGHRSKGGYTVDKLNPVIAAALPLPPEPEAVGEGEEAGA